MDEIPEDIRKAAWRIARAVPGPMSILHDWESQSASIAAALTAERVSATAAERERCAKIAQEFIDYYGDDFSASEIVRAIREPSQ